MVQQNSAKKDRVTLESVILTDEDIKKYQLAADDLYFISINEVVSGPIFKEALKQNLEIFDPDGVGVVQQLGQTDWQSPYTHPYFQRRKLGVVGQEIALETSNNLYLLNASGLKTGPFTLDTIESKLKDKSIMLTDLLSVDEGKTWLKLYQIEQFDRRRFMPQTKLPELPQGEVFDRSDIEVVNTLSHVQAGQQTEDAIVGLAIITNINSNKAQDKAYTEVVAESKKVEAGKRHSYGLPLLLAIIAASASAVYFYNQATRNESLIETSTIPKVKAVAPVARPAPIKRTPAATAPTLGKSKVINRINPSLPATKSYQKKAFKDSEAYEFHDNINDSAVPGDFVEGEMIMPESQLSDSELMDLESKLSKRFDVTPVESGDGPSSEDGLFDEETSY